MDDRELNQAISRARNTARRKAARIAKREQFSAEVINKIDPTRNISSQGMSRQERESFLTRLKNFNSRSFDVYKSANGDLISSEQWRRYKATEKAVNDFVRADLKSYQKYNMPIGDMNVLENFLMNRVARRGFILDDASGSSMFVMNRKPSQVQNVEALIDANNSIISEGYKQGKLNLAKDQFRKMVNAVGDGELIDQALDLSDNQFWGLWNYTEFANDVSFVYESVKLGMSLTKPSLTDTLSKAHRYVNWASELKV